MVINIRKIFFIFIFFTEFLNSYSRPIFLMINPAGHAKNVGRKLVEDYERSITFKMAEVLKQKLQDIYNIRCVLTRFPGEEIVPLQNASFANRLGVDLYIDLNIYRQDSIKPKIFLYNLVYNPIVDFAPRSFEKYKLIPIHKAHFLNINITKSYGEKIKENLTSLWHRKNFDCYGVFGIPIKSLVGIISPALCIEIGVCQQDQWMDLVDPIVESLRFLNNSF